MNEKINALLKNCRATSIIEVNNVIIINLNESVQRDRSKKIFQHNFAIIIKINNFYETEKSFKLRNSNVNLYRMIFRDRNLTSLVPILR